MPRTISANLKSHLALPVTTISFLWEITRLDNTVYRFTENDADIVYSGDTYQAINSGTMSAIRQEAKLSPDNFDFDVIMSDDDISKDDVVAGLFDHADVKVYMINRESTADGVIELMSGKLGDVIILDDHKVRIEFRSLTQLLSQGIGRSCGNECDADLGDDRCGVTLGPITDTGTLTGVIDNQVFTDSSRSEASNIYNYGLLTWTGGDNNGLTMEVKNWELGTKTFTLVSPMPFTVQIGDTYSVYPGCDKTKSACINKFGNVINFRGFAEIPGMDKILRMPDSNPAAGLHD